MPQANNPSRNGAILMPLSLYFLYKYAIHDAIHDAMRYEMYFIPWEVKMNYEKLIVDLLCIAKQGDETAYGKIFDVIREYQLENSSEIMVDKTRKTVFDPHSFERAIYYNRILRQELDSLIERNIMIDELVDLYKRTLLFEAPYDFDCYLRYIEWNRPKERKFYIPRRKALYPLVCALQELADDKLDLLAISLPPGVGKTTLAIFYLCWLSGRNPEMQILGSSHSNSFLRDVYDECLRVFDKYGEYLWYNVFPGVDVVGTNAKDMRIDLGNKKRFQTLEFSSVGSGNAGKVRATNLLYCDDLVEGIEQAMSKERLDKLWQAYTADLRQRKQGNVVKELHIATRWSVHDVIGRLESIYGESNRAKFIKLPALDENDESNFDYPYGIGFTTEFYHEQREVTDDVSWKALYMNEPVERFGLLIEVGELRRYFEKPNAEPDAIYAVCDIADGGGDFWSMPIAYRYGDDYYIDQWIFDNGKPEIVEDRIVNALIDNKVDLARFESNRAGGRVAESVQKKIKELGGKTHVTTKWNQTNKETRIIVSSSYMKSHFLFKDGDAIKNDKEYRSALTALTSYTMVGKNKHDDAPDSMAMLVDFVGNTMTSKVVIGKRPF